MTVVGRFAPSPSGLMHLGNARTALIAWLAARAAGGEVVLRIEDLDRDRCRPEFAEALREDLAWLGLDWDRETDAQALRDPAYGQAAARLASQGRVFECFCTRAELHAASAPHGPADEAPRCARGCRELDNFARESLRASGRRAALRVTLPPGVVEIEDALHGRLAEDVGREVGDLVIRRSDGLYAYALAVVVDDAADGVNQVVRGDDLLHAALRQAALQRLLGLPTPEYLHVPMVLGADGARLAKRHGAPNVRELKHAGAAPERIVGALAASAGLLERAEPAAPRQLVGAFDAARLRRAPASVRDLILDAR